MKKAFYRAARNGQADWKMHALSVFSLAVAFVCLASALLVVTNLDAVRARWSRVGRTTAYLRDGAEPAAVQDLREALVRTPGVKRVRVVSPEDARKELVTESGDASMGALPPQAFSTSIEIDFEGTVSDDEVKGVADKLKAMPVVDGVETYARWSERLGGLLRGGVLASLLLAVVVLGAVVSVVASTMRIVLERRKVEVEVQKLVGASDDYVRAPFLVEGAAQGGLGALLALGLLAVLYGIVRARFDGTLGLLLGVEPTFLPWTVALGLVALGTALGASSSFVSLRRMTQL
ncbi:MAG: ABC transporter permease [Polyangiaceae bacterium]|nr:ABC transporter permease [Polyangiaceae bacterium]